MKKIISGFVIFIVAELSFAQVGAASEKGTETLTEVKRSRNTLEELIVTAQRREESLQDVPISINAFGQETIEDRNFTSFSDVALSVPGLVVAQSFGSVSPTIRGIGADRFSASSEPGVALYVNDIYMGRPYLPQAALAQVARIEVLKGPQGTLYGRNTSGGALKIVTKRPTNEFEADLTIMAGSYDQVVGKAAVSIPLSENLYSLLSVYSERRDGYTDNITRNENVDAREVDSAQVSLAYDPVDWLRFDINIDTSRQHDTGPTPFSNGPVTFSIQNDRNLPPIFSPYDALLNPILDQISAIPGTDALLDQIVEQIGGKRSTDPRVVYNDFETFTDIESDGVSATVSAEIGSIDTKLITGYRDSSRNFPFDADFTDFAGAAFTETLTTGKQISAELQFSSNFEVPWGGSVHWLAGGFYFEEDSTEYFNFQAAPLLEILGVDSEAGQELINSVGDLIPDNLYPIFSGGNGTAAIIFDTDMTTKSYAGFMDLQWDVFDWMVVRGGARYTNDKKILNDRTIYNADPSNACENETGEESFEAVTYRAGVDIPFHEDRMIYLSYSEGFKSGGFNGLTCGSDSYEPEYVEAIELGIKSQWFDGLLQLNAALFDYSFTNIQVEKVVLLSTQVVNGPKAAIQGAEMDLVFLPFEFLSLDLNAGYLDAKYEEFLDDDPYTLLDDSLIDLAGNRLNKAPEWSGTAGAKFSYTFASGSEISARVEWSYTGEQFYDQFNHDFSRTDDYEIWNLYLNWDSPEHGVTLRGFLKNATDKTYVSGQFTPSVILGGPFLYYNQPKTVGVELSVSFE